MTTEQRLDANAPLSDYLKHHGDQLMSARAGKLELNHDALDEMIKCIAVSTMLAENLEEQEKKLEKLKASLEKRIFGDHEGVLQ